MLKHKHLINPKNETKMIITIDTETRSVVVQSLIFKIHDMGGYNSETFVSQCEETDEEFLDAAEELIAEKVSEDFIEMPTLTLEDVLNFHHKMEFLNYVNKEKEDPDSLITTRVGSKPNPYMPGVH